MKSRTLPRNARIIGTIAGLPIHQFSGRDGDGDDGAGGDEGANSGQNSGNANERTGSDDGKDGKTGEKDGASAIELTEIARARKEAAQYREGKSAAEKERDVAKAELQKIQDKDKDAKEILDRDLKAATTERDRYAVQNENLLLENAFLKAQTGKDGVKFRNSTAAWKLLDRDGLKIEDGKVVGLDEAIAELAKEHDYLILDGKAPDGKDDKNDKDGSGKPPAGKSGSGTSNNGSGKGPTLTKEQRARYPMLDRNRV